MATPSASPITTPVTGRPLEQHYLTAQQRLAELVRDAHAGTTPVPACPGWSVRDVLAHLTGLCADVLAGNIAGAATDDWTAAQVEARRHLDVAAVLAEWAQVAPTFAAMLDDFPGWYGRMVLADVTVHEQDIRGALGRPGARDTAALEASLDFVATTTAHPAAVALGRGPLEIRAGAQCWLAGTDDRSGGGDPVAAWTAAVATGAPPPEPAAPPVASVSSSPFELFRAFTGRRSIAQILALNWTGDPEPFLPLFAGGPFRLRSEDLVE